MSSDRLSCPSIADPSRFFREWCGKLKTREGFEPAPRGRKGLRPQVRENPVALGIRVVRSFTEEWSDARSNQWRNGPVRSARGDPGSGNLLDGRGTRTAGGGPDEGRGRGRVTGGFAGSWARRKPGSAGTGPAARERRGEWNAGDGHDAFWSGPVAVPDRHEEPRLRDLPP